MKTIFGYMGLVSIVGIICFGVSLHLSKYSAYGFIFHYFIHIASGFGLSRIIQLLGSKKTGAFLLIIAIAILTFNFPFESMFVALVVQLITVIYTLQFHLAVFPFIFFLTNTAFFPEFFSNQSRYHDPLVLSQETPEYTLEATQWKEHFWFYLDNKLQFSTVDFPMYYEPFTHPILINHSHDSIIVIGNDNQLLLSEIIKHKDISYILHLPQYKSSPYLKLRTSDRLWFTSHYDLENVFQSSQHPIRELQNSRGNDLIFIDVTNPDDLESNEYYTYEFYRLVHQALNENGAFITQALSPYLTPETYAIIKNTIEKAGFKVLEVRNQVPTMGEIGWIIGYKNDFIFKNRELEDIETKWLNSAAFDLLLSKGKGQPSSAGMNSIESPLLNSPSNR